MSKRGARGCLTPDTAHENDDADHVPGDPLARTERVFAYAVGTTAGGAGGYTVFERTNQLGSAVLLVIGAVFILIGVQGTRIIRFTSGSNTVEWDRKRKVEKEIAQAQDEGNLEKALGIAQGAAIFAPNLRSDIGPIEYEMQILSALSRSNNFVRVEYLAGPGQYADLLVQDLSGRKAYIEIKRYARLLPRTTVQQVIGVAISTGFPVLLVTYTEPTVEAQEAAAKAGVVEIVQWRSRSDTPNLIDALNRILSRGSRDSE